MENKPAVVTTGTNMDLSPFIGKNILPMPGDKQDPFGGEIPNDRQGYAEYRSHYEGIMDEVVQNDMHGMGKMIMTVNCEDTTASGQMRRMSGKKPEHEGCSIVFACNHVIHQDPVNPDGIEFVPVTRGGAGGFYLCPICSKSLERKRLNFDDIKIKCSACVLDTVMRISSQRPDRLKNLTTL